MICRRRGYLVSYKTDHLLPIPCEIKLGVLTLRTRFKNTIAASELAPTNTPPRINSTFARDTDELAARGATGSSIDFADTFICAGTTAGSGSGATRGS